MFCDIKGANFSLACNILDPDSIFGQEALTALSRKCAHTSMYAKDGKQILFGEFWIGVTRNLSTHRRVPLQKKKGGG